MRKSKWLGALLSIVGTVLLAVPAEAAVTLGFDRSLAVNEDGTTGVCGDVVLKSGHDAISLSWVQGNNSSVWNVTDARSFSLGGVTYTTSGSDMDIKYGMGGTFTATADNYFGYEVSLKNGYNMAINTVDASYVIGSKGIGYDVVVVDMASNDSTTLGSVEVRKAETADLQKEVSGVTLQGGKTYRIILRHYQWYTTGKAEHYPLRFLVSGNVTSDVCITPVLKTLTVGGKDILSKLSNKSADYTMAYGVSDFPVVSATVNDGCTVRVEQPVLTNMAAKVYTFDNNNNAVDTFTVNMYPGVAPSSSDLVYVSTPIIYIEGNRLAMTCTEEKAHIYYSLDGTDPRQGRAREYKVPVTVSGNGTVRAYASLPEFNLEDSQLGEENISGFASMLDPDHPESQQMPAFPGAEGGGRYATGGRGGKVYHVTTLEDDGTNPGSIRYAINQSGPRTIVFDVAGIIDLKADLVVYNGDLTIAGQTAPGDGICLRNYALHFRCDNVICRYIRSRLGEGSGAETDACWSRGQKKIILDHCSFSWSVDETASFYGMTDFTMQWCYVNESLCNATHVKGAHGYGGLWGGWNASYHHNMLANHFSRTPRLVVEPDGSVDLRNNVIYNWGPNLGCYGAAGGKFNFVGCYYKPGAATNNKPAIAGRLVACGVVSEETMEVGKFYLCDNTFDYSSPYLGSTALANARATDRDNTKGLHRDERVPLGDYIAKTEHYFPHTTTHTAEEGYEKVLAYGGCCLRRDTVDRRVVREVREGKYYYADGLTKGSNGSTGGLIDAPEDVEGYPEYTATTAELNRKVDSDSDGIPDWWEENNGLNPDDPTDALTMHKSGYSWLEYYLSSLVSNITKACSDEAGQTSGISETATDGESTVQWIVTAHQVSVPYASSIRAYSLDGNCCDYSPCDILSLSRLQSGVYIVVANMADGTVASKKLAVK